jgi:hypothetical protein
LTRSLDIAAVHGRDAEACDRLVDDHGYLAREGVALVPVHHSEACATISEMNSARTEIPFGAIAHAFRDGSVIPFLGAAASFAGAPSDAALPSGPVLGQIFADFIRYPGQANDPLSKIAEYGALGPAGRSLILSKIQSLFFDDLPFNYTCALTDFLRQLPDRLLPRLWLTTNYDTLVERALETRQTPYLALTQIPLGSSRAGRFLCMSSLSQPIGETETTLKELNERFETWNGGPNDPVVVFKVHGTARLRRGGGINDYIDSIVLGESDYVRDLEADPNKKYPAKLLRRIRDSNLLFLGYSLQDWNLRVFLERLIRITPRNQQGRLRHWACRLMKEPDAVEEKFWDHRGVTMYSVPLDWFLAELLKEAEGTAAGGRG